MGAIPQPYRIPIVPDFSSDHSSHPLNPFSLHQFNNMAPPRAAPAQAAKSVAPGRGVKKVPVQAPAPPAARTFSDTMRQPDVKETCPLCIEDLDDTDKDFYPCPCGYQVCLFCYGKLKEKCNSMCPNCRREYGEPVDAPTVRQHAAEAEEMAVEASRAGNGNSAAQRPGTSHQAGGHHLQPALSAAAAAAAAHGPSRTPPVPATKPDTAAAQQQQQRRAQDTQAAAGYSKRMDAVAALPTGATWAAGGQAAPSRHTPLSDIEHPSQQQAQPSAVDSTAWPSLADSTTAAVAASSMQPRQARHDHSQSFQSMETASSNQSHHLRSASASSASAEGMHSRSSSSQDLQQDLQHNQPHPPTHAVPPHLMDAFATAQVCSTVHGVRHSVNVPLLNHSPHVHAHPDAAAMRASLQQAVKAGAMSSREAAGRLMALLRQTSQAEAEHGARSLLAAGKLPPGFGPPGPAAHPAALYQPAQHAQPSASGVNHLDPSIPQPQLGKFRPIQPPLHNGNGLFAGTPGRPPLQQQHQQQGFTFILNGVQQQQPARDRSYSMWSGLPGLDAELSAALSEWQAQGPGLPYHAHQLSPPPGMRPDPQASLPPTPMPTASSPPPGFGATAYAAGSRLYDSPVGTAPNALQAQLAGLSRPPPPGMTAYRPQL